LQNQGDALIITRNNQGLAFIKILQ